MKVLAIIQARMKSTRLPGKVLKKLGEKSVLEILIERLRKSKTIDEMVVATTTSKEDDIIIKLLESIGVKYYRGSEDDVLDRYFKAATLFNAKNIVRITADNPLTNVNLIDLQVKLLAKNNYDYTTVKNVILGLGSEVFTFNALKKAWEKARRKYQREHVTPYIYEHPEIFKIKCISAPNPLRRSDIRLTIDTPEDLKLYQELYNRFKDMVNVNIRDVIRFLDKNPHIKEINRNIKQKHYMDV